MKEDQQQPDCEVQSHSADVELLLVCKDEEDPPELPHIKEEQEELWTNQEGEQLQGPEEAEIIKFTFNPVAVKSEEDDDEEKPQSSQLHQTQTEEIKTEADEEDCRGPEPARDFTPCLQSDTDDNLSDSSGADTDDSYDWKKSSEPQSFLDFLKDKSGRSSGEKSLSCYVCGKQFSYSSELQRHMRIHSGEKPYSCSICSKRFIQKIHLTRHMALHTGEKRYICSVCGQRFTWPSQFKRHQQAGCRSPQLHQSQTEDSRDAGRLIMNDREDCGGSEPAENFDADCASGFGRHRDLQRDDGVPTNVESFSCSVCGESFPRKKSLKNHMRLNHAEEKCFSCSVCEKTFQSSGNLATHMRVHTGEKPFSCSVCGKGFARSSHLPRHLRTHTGEKPFNCSVCKASFSQTSTLSQHMRVHTGEKPFSCSVCGKTFAQKGNLTKHMTVHTGEKQFVCSVCDERFTQLVHIKNHKCVGENSDGQLQQGLSTEGKI